MLELTAHALPFVAMDFHMPIFFRTIVLAFSLTLAFPGVSCAADTSQIIGKWVTEKFANGNVMVFEFKATTIANYGIGPSGNRVTDLNQTADVSYRDLGDSIAIEFKGGGGMMAQMKGPKTMLLIFPGMGSRQLTRSEP